MRVRLRRPQLQDRRDPRARPGVPGQRGLGQRHRLPDLPEVFGDWNSVFRRFSRWSQKGVWWRIFEAMADDPDFEYLIVDSTIVRAHQHAAGAKKGGLMILPRPIRLLADPVAA